MMSKIWRTLIKQEILTAFHSSGQSANTQASPAEDISISSSGVATQDPEPMEAQEMNTTTHPLGNYRVGSATFVANKTNENSDLNSSIITKRPPKPRQKLSVTRTPDAKMRQNMSATKARLNKSSNGQKI